MLAAASYSFDASARQLTQPAWSRHLPAVHPSTAPSIHLHQLCSKTPTWQPCSRAVACQGSSRHNYKKQYRERRQQAQAQAPPPQPPAMAGHAFFSQAIPHLIKAAAESGGSPFIQWCDSHGSHTSFYSQTLFEAGIKDWHSMQQQAASRGASTMVLVRRIAGPDGDPTQSLHHLPHTPVPPPGSEGCSTCSLMTQAPPEPTWAHLKQQAGCPTPSSQPPLEASADSLPQATVISSGHVSDGAHSECLHCDRHLPHGPSPPPSISPPSCPSPTPPPPSPPPDVGNGHGRGGGPASHGQAPSSSWVSPTRPTAAHQRPQVAARALAARAAELVHAEVMTAGHVSSASSSCSSQSSSSSDDEEEQEQGLGDGGAARAAAAAALRRLQKEVAALGGKSRRRFLRRLAARVREQQAWGHLPQQQGGPNGSAFDSVGDAPSGNEVSSTQVAYYGLVVQSFQSDQQAPPSAGAPSPSHGAADGCYLLKTANNYDGLTGCTCTHFTLTRVCQAKPLYQQLQDAWLSPH